MGTEVSQHVGGEERGATLEWGAYGEEGVDAGAEKTQRGGGAGVREVYLTYMS